MIRQFLTLTSFGFVALFSACSQPQTSSPSTPPLSNLAGSEWGFEDQSERYVQFKSDGQVHGFGGCNNFFGNYETNGQKLKISPLGSTRKYCDSLMDDETQFLAALQDAAYMDATHLRLVIRDKNDEERLSLIRRDWD